MSYEDLEFIDWDNNPMDGHTWTLKKELIESGRKFIDITWCVRLYSLAYDSPVVEFFWMSESLAAEKPNVADGYTVNMRRLWLANLQGPSDSPFDVVNFARTTNEGFETTKTEWVSFRKTKRSLVALEWHSLCFMYSKSNKNTGIVINGEIVGNKSHSDNWANNEFNFLPSVMFQPFKNTGGGHILEGR